MANPLIHALVLLVAIVVPGGLLLYFAWHAVRHNSRGQKKYKRSTPEEAQKAFLSIYPKESLRARSRLNRLNAYKTKPRKKPPE